MNKKQLQIQIDYFLNHYFQSYIKERGIRYFYNRNVTNPELHEGLFTAKVHGTNEYTVEIDTQHLENSYCNCPYDNRCKHLVAALLELKKILEESLSISQILIDDLDTYEPLQLYKYFSENINYYIDYLYKNLSKSGYYNSEQSTMIIQQLFASFETKKYQHTEKIQIILLTVILKQLLDKALKYDLYRFRQNRFLTFFNELIHQGYPMLLKEAENSQSIFHQWFTSFLFGIIDELEPGSPFEKLIATWLLCEKNQEKLTLYANSLENKNNHLFLTKLSSLLFLQADQGAKALSLLKEIMPSLHQSDYIDHFLMMADRKDYIMMKHWFEFFFHLDKPKPGTILGNLYEEMLIETGTTDEKISIVWKNWLEHPSFQTYQKRIKNSDANDKQIILDYILPELKKDLYRPQTEAIYFQIIAEENLFEEGIHTLLTQKKEIATLSPEIEAFLHKISKKEPTYILPFYHQLVERLVHKKSRVHYEEAATYIQRLADIYKRTNQEQRFSLYIKGLKYRLKTFRAFIQELNKIEL